MILLIITLIARRGYNFLPDRKLFLTIMIGAEFLIELVIVMLVILVKMKLV